MQGEKLQNRVTIQDIAREVDMSIATVSAVLGNKSHCYASEKTKTMIREKAREMGPICWHAVSKTAGHIPSGWSVPQFRMKSTQTKSSA